MKQALISTLEQRETGYRVAQIVEQGQTFPVAIELFWTACSDDVEQDKFWYDPVDQIIKPNPVPTIRIPNADENKYTAMGILASTDWVNQPDVTNPDINPHLLNHAEFITYRSQIRAIAINPTVGNLDWPVEPVTQWSSV